MATRAIDERQIMARGFILEARNLLAGGQSLWSRADEPDRGFTDDEVLQWLEQHPDEKEH